uniref:Uncharacterized protein n=1 Tax=Rousettus aegyptiacus TaxID=9407 RepID=A0A7J8JFQ9_ROUAE|nr:hypothetical protein HJG63_010094 [Rousettus aegyptiacus]
MILSIIKIFKMLHESTSGSFLPASRPDPKRGRQGAWRAKRPPGTRRPVQLCHPAWTASRLVSAPVCSRGGGGAAPQARPGTGPQREASTRGALHETRSSPLFPKALQMCKTWTWLHSVAVSMSALHAEGPGIVPQWSHSPWSTAMPH